MPRLFFETHNFGTKRTSDLRQLPVTSKQRCMLTKRLLGRFETRVRFQVGTSIAVFFLRDPCEMQVGSGLEPEFHSGGITILIMNSAHF